MGERVDSSRQHANIAGNSAWAAASALLSSLRKELSDAAWAAAIPHWFDIAMLSALQPERADQSATFFEDLKGLPFVSSVAGRGYCIHERVRPEMRRQWQLDHPEQFQLMNDRAAAHLARRVMKDTSDNGLLVELIYHMDVEYAKSVDSGAPRLEKLPTRFDYGPKLLALLADNTVKMPVTKQEERSTVARDLAAAFRSFGLSLRADKLNGQSAAAFRQAIALDPENAATYINLGNVLRSIKQYPDAEHELRHAIELQPQSAGTHFNLGTLLREIHRTGEAEQEFRLAIELDPQYARAHYGLAHLLRETKRTAEAEQEFRQAIALAPGDAPTHNGLGILLVKLRRYDEAVQEFRRAIDVDPNYPTAHDNLGLLFRTLGRFDEAVAEAERALHLEKSYGHLLGLIGAYKQVGEINKARVLEPEARQLKNNDDYELACLESITGNADTALKYLAQASQGPKFDANWAREDPDLLDLHNESKFWTIVGGGPDSLTSNDDST